MNVAIFRSRVPAAIAAGLLLALSANSQTPPPTPPVPAPGADQAQDLTRGPIQEAFGQPLVFNAQPGPIAPKKPPELIQEVPPDEKPEGDNVAWIPGYWWWDDEGKNFIWVSGFWRTVPPGQVWMPGYWNTVDNGYQWVSGYWRSSQTQEVEYLPPPPETLEAGPSTEATAEGQVWTPGVWVWRETRYLWRPGFWTAANPDWVWMPAHYAWTPSGFVFIDGYWDYPLLNRGLLFAPVTFTSIPAGFVYTPAVAIDLRFLTSALFSRPAYDHYYFGDYYAESYAKAGIYPWFAFHNSRVGCDPLFAQTSFVNLRHDPQWTEQIRSVYFDRRDHAADRPPHTYRQFTDWARKADPDGRHPVSFARPLSEVQRLEDFPVHLVHLDAEQRRTVHSQADQVQKYRTERIRVEQQAARDLPRPGSTTSPKVEPSHTRTAPTRVKMPEAPRLAPTEPGVGGKVPTPTGRAPSRRPPPDAPRVPEPAPPTSPGVPKTPAKLLPHPEDNLRPPTGTRPPAKEREPVPPGRREIPEPGRIAPPAKEPPAAKEPPKKELPKKEPPKKDKDKD
jgi:hypothetical protein